MIKEKTEKGMKIIRMLKWKNIESWRILYAWLTYVAPHLRYGSLVFYKG